MISEPKQNHPVTIPVFFGIEHGSLNVPIEHHPTIRYMVYNGYYKVMSNIPKMGQLPTPVEVCFFLSLPFCFLFLPFSNDFSPKNVSGITSAQASEVIQPPRSHLIIDHQLSQVGTLRCHPQWVKSPN